MRTVNNPVRRPSLLGIQPPASDIALKAQEGRPDINRDTGRHTCPQATQDDVPSVHDKITRLPYLNAPLTKSPRSSATTPSTEKAPLQHSSSLVSLDTSQTIGSGSNTVVHGSKGIAEPRCDQNKDAQLQIAQVSTIVEIIDDVVDATIIGAMSVGTVGLDQAGNQVSQQPFDVPSIYELINQVTSRESIFDLTDLRVMVRPRPTLAGSTIAVTDDDDLNLMVLPRT
ncbi:hypothetical protein BX600DRAFT_445004 [Xylariales sp. PMI_506]|nr:hypothetical protein BX600DRAFT_445004 [Xylariales sp. PMI_506]